MKHKVDTGDHQPVRQPVRRLTWARQEEADRKLDEMLEKGVAEPSQSLWSSPIVLATKSDGSIRFCVDYRQLNDLTERIPIPSLALMKLLTSLLELSGSVLLISPVGIGRWNWMRTIRPKLLLLLVVVFSNSQ